MAKKTRKKTRAARHERPGAAVTPPTPDEENRRRFRGEPRVFRFWHDRAGFGRFASGTWRGAGLHGNPEKDGEYKWMRARFVAEGLELNILTAPPAPRPRGFLALLFFLNRQSRPGAGGEEQKIFFPAANLRTDLDVAAWEKPGLCLELQVIDRERMYLVLRALGRDGRIEFAGPIGRE